MYYNESSDLIRRRPNDSNLLFKLDRELAHTYAPSGKGFTELALLTHALGCTANDVLPLLVAYENEGIVFLYTPNQCVCGEVHDPREVTCPDCGAPLAQGQPASYQRFAIIKQPQAPAYDPQRQPADPDVFISYRRGDCETLATDIYYRLQAQGKQVFLDKGEIPVGANPEATFLRAASKAPYFIALVSENYFGSPYCKKEIAHSLRCSRRFIRVNVPPVPSVPADMPWIDGPNWNSEKGSQAGLSPELEQSLLSAIQIPNSVSNYDLRREACVFLLNQLAPAQLNDFWNRLPWTTDYDFSRIVSKQEKISLIRQEIIEERLPLMCNALAP